MHFEPGMATNLEARVSVSSLVRVITVVQRGNPRQPLPPCHTAKGNFVASSSRGPPRRSGFRARITGLPDQCSWQVRRR